MNKTSQDTTEKNKKERHTFLEIRRQLCRSRSTCRCKLSDYIIRQQLREIAEKIDDGGETHFFGGQVGDEIGVGDDVMCFCMCVIECTCVQEGIYI